MDYCNVLSYGKNRVHAARIVTRLGRSEHITHVLHDHHWLPLDIRIVYIRISLRSNT